MCVNQLQTIRDVRIAFRNGSIDLTDSGDKMGKYIDKDAATDIVINAMQAYDGKDPNAIRLLRTIATTIRALPDTSCSNPEKEDISNTNTEYKEC